MFIAALSTLKTGSNQDVLQLGNKQTVVYPYNAILLSDKQGMKYWFIQEHSSVQFSSVQSLSHVRPFATPWIAERQASLPITNSWSSLRLRAEPKIILLLNMGKFWPFPHFLDVNVWGLDILKHVPFLKYSMSTFLSTSIFLKYKLR